MFSFSLTGLIRRLLIGTLVVGLLGTVAFFALTRTEVGRGELRERVEQQFSRAFAGSLRVGTLEGNLVSTLHAQDIRLLDPDGALVARIDSVALEPRWMDLLQGTISARTVTLVNPSLRLHRSADGRWNVAEALTPRRPRRSTSPLRFALTEVRVFNGSVTTSHDGPVPTSVADGWVFNYADSRATNVQLRATAEWSASDQLVDIFHLSGRLPDPDVQLQRLRGQVVHTEDGWAFNQIEAYTPRTELQASGLLRRAASDQPLFADPVVELEMGRSQLDADLLHRLFPRLPIRDVITAEARLRGPLSDLTVDTLSVAHADSRLGARGAVRGLPDSARFDVQMAAGALYPSEVRTVYPALDSLVRPAWGPTALEGQARGVYRPGKSADTTLSVRSQFTVANRGGRLRGTAVWAQPRGAPPTYRVDALTDSVDVGLLAARSDLQSRLSGRLQVRGQGVTARTAAGRVDLRLNASTVAQAAVDSLALAATVDPEAVSGTLSFRQPGAGRVSASGRFVRASAQPSAASRSPSSVSATAVSGDVGPPASDVGRSGPSPASASASHAIQDAASGSEAAGVASYRLDVTSEALNLATLMPDRFAATALSGALSLSGRGTTWEALAGTATLDLSASRVQRDTASVRLPAGRTTLTVAAPDASAPRVRIGGDYLSFTLDGDLPPRPLWATGRLWAAELQQAVRSAYQKPYPGAAPPQPTLVPPADTTAGAADQRQALRLAARSALEAAGRPQGLSMRARLTLKRTDVWSALLPNVDTRGEPLRATADLTVGADSLRAQATAQAGFVRVGPDSVRALDAQAQLGGALTAGRLLETLSSRLTVQSAAAEVGPFTLREPQARFSFADQSGELVASAARRNGVGPARLDATLDVQDARNVLTLRDFRLDTRTASWSTTAPTQIDLYADAAVISPLRLQSVTPYAPAPQQVEVRGTWSSAPTDTVHVEARDVMLYPFSELVGLDPALAGRASGSATLTGGGLAPDASGTLTVDRLSLDRRLLGDLVVSGRHQRNTPDIELSAVLRPSRPAPPRLADAASDARVLASAQTSGGSEAAPADTASALLDGPSYHPRPLRTVERNRLRVNGSFRPAAFTYRPAQRGLADADRLLDFEVSVERADLFFFEYIFEEEITGVEGFTAGTGTIRGSFYDPIFGADMRVAEGRFRLPKFGLEYGVEGPVTVDSEGIKLEDVVVRDGDEGRAAVTGAVLFNDYRYFSFDLAGRLSNIQVIDVLDAPNLPFYGQIRASGPATLTGPLSDATLQATDVRTTPESELYIPVSRSDFNNETGFIVFADSTGGAPDLEELSRRDNVLADRPAGEPTFIDGLDIDINVQAPRGSTVRLVFDPLVGDVVTAVGSGRVQIQRQEGELSVYGTLDVASGNYLFTAGEVFVRRFTIDEGSITWDGDPINAQLDLQASYRTRASTAGLNLPDTYRRTGRIPLDINLAISGRVEAPRVDLNLALVRDERNVFVGSETLDAVLNQPDLATEYATSVLLTNTFLLTTTPDNGDTGASAGGRLATAGNQLAFNSVSQLVAAQLNRYLSEVLPNLDVNVGLQGENPQDLDLIYGAALRLLDDQLIIRGEGVYTGDATTDTEPRGTQGEVVVELRLTPNVSVEAFYRRSGDDLTGRQLTNTTGAGLSYQTDFTTWGWLFDQLFGWLVPDRPSDAPTQRPAAEASPAPPDSTSDRPVPSPVPDSTAVRPDRPDQ